MFGALFSKCCCMELLRPESENELVPAASAVTDEALNLTGMPSTLLTSANPRIQAKEEKARDARARDERAKEAEAEKKRLQGLVHSFARKAYKGIPCTFLDVEAGKRVKTIYKINKVLSHLTIMSDQRSDKVEMTCPIASIQDVYSLEEDGAAVFPRELIEMLKPGEEARLLMFVCNTDKDKWIKICFLEESPESKNALLECLRILCLYAITAPTQDPVVKEAQVLPTAATGGA